MSDLPTLRRDDLAQFFGSNPRLLRAFEEHSAALEEATNGVADTQAMKDATVIVLSANGDFTNERLLQIGDGIDIEITANDRDAKRQGRGTDAGSRGYVRSSRRGGAVSSTGRDIVERYKVREPRELCQ
jgi:hypothetical protein